MNDDYVGSSILKYIDINFLLYSNTRQICVWYLYAIETIVYIYIYIYLCRNDLH